MTIRSTAFLIASITVIVANAQQPNVERNLLLQQDLTISGYEGVLVEATIPVGGREGRHSHPGPLLAYVLEGTFTVEYQGKPTVTYQAGESFFVEAGNIHEGINNGNTPVRVIATFIVEEGRPLTTQAQ